MAEELEKGRASARIPKIISDITDRGEDPTSSKNRKYAAGVLARQWAVKTTSNPDIQKTLVQRFIPTAEKAIHEHLSKLYPDRKIEVPVQKDPYPVKDKPPAPVAQPGYTDHLYHSRWMSLENQLADHFRSGSKEYPEQWDRAANAYQSAEEHHGAYDSPYKRTALGHLKALSELKRTPVKEEPVTTVAPKNKAGASAKKVNAPAKVENKTATKAKAKEKMAPIPAAEASVKGARERDDKSILGAAFDRIERQAAKKTNK
jgi:hypothetical protein